MLGPSDWLSGSAFTAQRFQRLVVVEELQCSGNLETDDRVGIEVQRVAYTRELVDVVADLGHPVILGVVPGALQGSRDHSTPMPMLTEPGVHQ